MIHHFPEWFYLMIREFLYPNEYSELCNTSKQYFQTIKRQTIRYYLNYRYSCRYCKDKNFQRLLLSKVISSRFQVGLKFMFLIQHIPNNIPLQNIYQLRCNIPLKVEQIQLLYHITDIEFMNIPDITHFPCIIGCEILTLRNLPSLIYIERSLEIKEILLDSCSSIQNVTTFMNIPNITFIRCESLTDISCLGHKNQQRKINITECDNIKDVTHLKDIDILRLRYLKSISDISTLGNVRHLEIVECPQINDIHYLANNYYLNIDSCDFDLKGYQSLSTVSILKLNDCSIEDVSFFHNLHSIELAYCPLLVDVSPLGNVYQVILRSCSCILHVNGLGNVTSLSLIRCDSLCDISGLGENNQEVKILYCSRIHDYSSLQGVKKVEIK